MKKYLKAIVLFLGIAFLRCAPAGFSANSIEKAVEKEGSYNVSVSMDETATKKNVKITLLELKGNTENIGISEERKIHFIGMCVGATGALAIDANDNLGYLTINDGTDVNVFAIPYCAYLAKASLQKNMSNEDIGNDLITVWELQRSIKEWIEEGNPFEVIATMQHKASGYNVFIDLQKVHHNREYNAMSDDEKFGYFAGLCSASMGLIALDSPEVNFEKLHIGYQNNIWEISIPLCAKLLLQSKEGTSVDEIGKAIFANMKQIK